MTVPAPINPWMEDRLERYGRGQTVLDVGCGRGWWLRRMADAGLRGVGVEPLIDRAVHAHPAIVGDGRRLPVASGSVGLVWCIHVLHHLADPGTALAEIRRVLAPGGHLVLAETVEDHPAIRVARRLRPEWDGVRIASRFTTARCVEMLDRAGLDVTDRRQHSWVSFAAWASPVAPRRAWVALSHLEDRVSGRWSGADRFGAHFECVATAR